MAGGTSRSMAQTPKPVAINDPELFKSLKSGQTALGQNKYAEAEDSFRKALERDPKNSVAETNLGVALIKQGKFEAAQEILHKCVENHPGEPDGWLDLATSYQATGKVTESLDCLHKFLKLAPNNPNAPQVRSMITLLQQNEKMHSGVKANDLGDDYLADAIQNGTVRFTKERMPLKIYLKPATSVPGYKPEYDDIIKQAFSEWQAAAPDQLSFTYVPSEEGADIVIVWTNDPSKMISSAEGGHAMVSPSPTGILRSDITLLSTQAVTHKPLDDNHLKHIALHEIGHALGICGHSPKAEDIMYGIVMPTATVSNLSDRDKKTMVALYTGPAVARNDINRVNQGDSSSPVSQLAKLVNEGSKAMQGGNFPLALEKFEQALKLDPQNFSLKQNLAALNANMANICFMKRDFNGAIVYFKKAIPVLEQSPDKANLKLVLQNYSTVLKVTGKAADAAKVDAQLAALK